jgi:hypothetical protein
MFDNTITIWEISNLIIWVSSLYLIPKYIGLRRNIGWKWSLFFTLNFTWIGGLIITLLSQKKGKKPRKIINNILGSFFMLGVVFQLSKLLKINEYYINYWDYLPVIQGLGLAIYCFSRNDGVPNSDTIA